MSSPTNDLFVVTFWPKNNDQSKEITCKRRRIKDVFDNEGNKFFHSRLVRKTTSSKIEKITCLEGSS